MTIGMADENYFSANTTVPGTGSEGEMDLIGIGVKPICCSMILYSSDVLKTSASNPSAKI